MDLERALRFDNWANLETLATLKSGNPPSQAIDILAHTVAVSQLWLSRATGTPPPSSIWPRWTLTTIEAQLDSCFVGWKSCLIAGHPSRSFDYVDSRGGPGSNTPEELIVEIICHSAHHRGQVALLLRQNGSEPAVSTDFIPHCGPATFDLALRVALTTCWRWRFQRCRFPPQGYSHGNSNSRDRSSRDFSCCT
jgi:uncharacterized damage-inducible protein DinB